MVPFFVDYLERLEMLHTEMDQALTGLSQAALDCSLGPGINSLAILAAHVAGSEMYWIGDLIIRRATTRVRALEFQTVGIPGEILRTRLAQALADSRASVAQLTLADLEGERTRPDQPGSYTVAWCLLHALEHTAMHVGHMQLTRQLLPTMVEGKSR